MMKADLVEPKWLRRIGFLSQMGVTERVSRGGLCISFLLRTVLSVLSSLSVLSVLPMVSPSQGSSPEGPKLNSSTPTPSKTYLRLRLHRREA